jgi:predicted HicB family RNase H-like nuclease
MSRGKSSISKASSYKEIGEFWDTHDISDYWDQLEPVEFEIDIQGEEIVYDIDEKISKIIQINAKRRGISVDTLLNLWLQEELQIDQTVPIGFEASIQLQEIYYAIDMELSDNIRAIAKKRDISANTLANLWLMRKIQRDRVETTLFESGTKFPKKYYAVDKELSDKIQTTSNQRGISPVTLVNLYLQKELQKEQETDTPLPKKHSVIKDESQLHEEVKALANRRGISIETLMLEWQKIDHQKKLQNQVVQVKASG